MKLFRIVAKVLPIIAKIVSVLLPGPVSTVVNVINGAVKAINTVLNIVALGSNPEE